MVFVSRALIIIAKMNIYDIENFNNVFDTINKNFNSFFNNSVLSRLLAR